MLSRVVTGALAAAVALAATLWREPWGVVALAVFLLVVSGIELATLIRARSATVIVVALLLTAPGAFLPLEAATFQVYLAVLWALGVTSLIVWRPHYIPEGLGLVCWVSSGLWCALVLGLQQDRGDSIITPSLLLLALLPLWVGDSLAYLVGSTFGSHKLAPQWSPNKTLEGAAANFIGCLLAAVAIGKAIHVPPLSAAAVGISTGLLGQVGDLLQSRIKRLAGVKDSGRLLPGHGGALDRLDSFLFSSFPSLVCLQYLSPMEFHVKQWPW